MPIDSSIYFNQQPLDVAGSLHRGFELADQIYARAKQKKMDAEQEAFKMKADAQNQIKAQQENAIGEARYASQAFDPKRVNNQQTWDLALQQGIADGHGEAVAKLPRVYDPNLQGQIYSHAVSLLPQEDQLKNELTRSQIQKNYAETKKIGTEKTDAQKKLTNDQSNAITFGKRAEGANKILEDLEPKYDRSSIWSGVGSVAPNVLRGGNGVQNDQAELNFLTAVLRKESGATISDSELKNGEKLYFKRAGDDPTTVANKAAARSQAIEGLKAAAGSAYQTVPLVAPKSPPKTENKYSWSNGEL